MRLGPGAIRRRGLRLALVFQSPECRLSGSMRLQLAGELAGGGINHGAALDDESPAPVAAFFDRHLSFRFAVAVHIMLPRCFSRPAASGEGGLQRQRYRKTPAAGNWPKRAHRQLGRCRTRRAARQQIWPPTGLVGSCRRLHVCRRSAWKIQLCSGQTQKSLAMKGS